MNISIKRELRSEITSNFRVLELGYDFMGYRVERSGELSFHHMIVPKRFCSEYGLGDGYYYWNGCVLVQRTSHNYLHLIEHYDLDRYDYITLVLIDIHDIGIIGLDNLRKIRDCLVGFEREYSGYRNRKGKEIIKEEYISERVLTKKI